MTFNSIDYLLFLLFIVATTYLLKNQMKIYFLLFSSYIFIGYYHIESFIFLVLSSSFTYFIALKIEKNKSEKIKKTVYRLGLLFNLILLLSLKFFEKKSFETFKTESILIFIGISYYSLQNIAFLTDTYFKRLKFKPTFLEYSLYNSFFPKILAGPIEFPSRFIPQIQLLKNRKIEFNEGVQRILLGLIKKVVVADRLGEIIHFNFDIETSQIGLTNLIVSYLFTFQLYFDFSGYSDIAIGSAKLLGIDLKENFQFPLNSKSITEFWRKWHISLTSWLTNYVYYPISFRLRKLDKINSYISILITFFISGIWHGFAFTFTIYASLHAIYIILELITQRQREFIKKHTNPFLHSFVTIFITFNLVSISLIFFRSNSINKAFSILKTYFDVNHFYPKEWLQDFFSKLAITGEIDYLFNFSMSIFLLLLILFNEQKIRKLLTNKKFNWTFYIISILLIFMFGVFKSHDQFIYTQF